MYFLIGVAFFLVFCLGFVFAMIINPYHDADK